VALTLKKLQKFLAYLVARHVSLNSGTMECPHYRRGGEIAPLEAQ